ncbi:hypothetical protein FRC01_012537 [Tulasnella sp. 417]|nr:hypothetical protein FRC01_012537 [Tulasnella sp. 417]
MLYNMTRDNLDLASGGAMGSVVAGGCSELEAFQFLSDIRRPMPSFEKLLAQFLSRQTRLNQVDIFTSLTKSVATGLATSSQSIRQLTCHLSPEETGTSIPEAIELITLSCSALEGLTTITDAEEFSFADLKSLLRCKTIRKLRVHYWSLSSPVLEKDVEEMAASWPNLEFLYLLTSNPFPRPQTPLSILTHIAQCMQSTLGDLGLDVFADETVQLTTHPDATRFTNLQHLVIGDSSTVKDGYEPDVANYLASICPHNVEMSRRGRSLPVEGRLDPWDKVAAFFKHSCSGAGKFDPRDINYGSSSL